jgi:alkanesulfonate monooxygenase SsuD/methylene tetrahydromethanopterin reductase-like flavin-dependent oxidoreductase (luciferase family)
LAEAGLNAAAIAQRVDESWVWRNVCVAETDAEAERIAVPAFLNMQERRTEMRNRVFQEQGVSIVPMPAPGSAPPARTVIEHSLVYGSPATVAAKLAAVGATGVGGLIMQFRLGPMSYEDTARSLTLFQEQVRPALRGG